MQNKRGKPYFLAAFQETALKKNRYWRHYRHLLSPIIIIKFKFVIIIVIIIINKNKKDERDEEEEGEEEEDEDEDKEEEEEKKKKKVKKRKKKKKKKKNKRKRRNRWTKLQKKRWWWWYYLGKKFRRLIKKFMINGKYDTTNYLQYHLSKNLVLLRNIINSQTFRNHFIRGIPDLWKSDISALNQRFVFLNNP